MNMDNCFDWRLEGERYALQEGGCVTLEKNYKNIFSTDNNGADPVPAKRVKRTHPPQVGS